MRSYKHILIYTYICTYVLTPGQNHIVLCARDGAFSTGSSGSLEGENSVGWAAVETVRR